MFHTDEMKKILNKCGYSIKFYNDNECGIFFFGTHLCTVVGEYSLYNWMCDCELL